MQSRPFIGKSIDKRTGKISAGMQACLDLNDESKETSHQEAFGARPTAFSDQNRLKMPGLSLWQVCEEA